MGTFEVRGNARRTVNYDIAVINIDFIASEKTSTRASEKVLEYCERFLEKVEKEAPVAVDYLAECEKDLGRYLGRGVKMKLKQIDIEMMRMSKLIEKSRSKYLLT